MAIYKARHTWVGKKAPMDYLERGDQVEIRGKVYTVRDAFQWDGKLVYDTDYGLLYADELQRVE
jgi:hypothetical protein